MPTKRNTGGLRISVPLIKHVDKFEIAPMICESLNQLGHDAFITTGQSQAYLDSDIFLLLGSFYRFGDFQRVFNRHNKPRPVTILWQWDPLPPLRLSPQAEQQGLQLGNLCFNSLGTRNSHLVRKLVPFSSKACRAARRFTARRVKKQLDRDCRKEFEQLDASELFSVMAPHAWLKKHLPEGWIDYLFVTTPPKKHFLQSKGIDCHHVPIGYHPTWGRKMNLQRDIDVLYLGRLNCDYRRDTLKMVTSALSPGGYKIKVVTDDCYGEQRTRLLNRTKIALDIPRVGWDTGGMRFLMYMSCGAMVLSCVSADTSPYQPDVHYIRRERPDFVDSILYYLECENRRTEVTTCAFELVTGELSMKKMLSNMLEICNAYPSISARCM